MENPDPETRIMGIGAGEFLLQQHLKGGEGKITLSRQTDNVFANHMSGGVARLIMQIISPGEMLAYKIPSIFL